MVSNVQKAVNHIQAQGIQALAGAISTGSGQTLTLDGIPELLQVGYGELPGFGELDLMGHDGFLRIVEGTDGLWAVWTGRRHFYQGYSFDEIGQYIDISIAMGAGKLIVLNSAGGFDPDMNVGDLVLIENYKNFIPFDGRVIPVEGEPWIATSAGLASRIRHSAKKLSISPGNGDYVGVPGPTYETAAEVKWLRSLGCEVVGMSTVPELVRAKECGMESIAVSLIANVHGKGKDVTHEEVVSSGKAGADMLGKLVAEFLRIGNPDAVI